MCGSTANAVAGPVYQPGSMSRFSMRSDIQDALLGDGESFPVLELPGVSLARQA